MSSEGFPAGSNPDFEAPLDAADVVLNLDRRNEAVAEMMLACGFEYKSKRSARALVRTDGVEEEIILEEFGDDSYVMTITPWRAKWDAYTISFSRKHHIIAGVRKDGQPLFDESKHYVDQQLELSMRLEERLKNALDPNARFSEF